MADANNVEIQQQLNKLLTDQKRIMRDNTRILREQVNLTQQMAETLGQANINNSVIEKSRTLKESLKTASDHAKQFSQQSQDMAAMTSGALGETDQGFEGLIAKYGQATGTSAAWAAATGGFIEGVQKGFNLLKTGLSGILSLAGSVVQGMFSIGKAILAIPFKIFNAFVNEANRMRGEPLLAREFEETRKAFGDFGEDLSKHVIGGYRNLRGELAKTGLSVWRVLGYRHEQLKFVREQFEALGAVAHEFGLEIAQQAEYFAAYQKGLGLSGDMMKGLAQATQGTGESFEETLRTTTNFTTSLGKQFGISQKVIGRDVGEMAKDLKTFGSVGVRQMAQLSTFARKLGADFKDLLGVVNRFDNFEDAAESAARLAQAFGLNVDAMEMINEQDPGKRIEMLRKAFYQTGKDITKLTRQERNYLAATAGIEDQALNSVFALGKQGQTYEEIAAAGQTAEQQQITQAEAMEKLSDSIERMIKSGHRTGGFFDRFMKGFRRGVRWSSEFWKVMRNIKRSLWASERAGRAVGRIFVKAFPGVKKFLKGMAQLFDPKKFRAMGGKVMKAFDTFLKDLGDPKKAKNAFNNFLKSMQKAFFEMEGVQEGALKNIVGGLKKIFGAIGKILISAIKIAAKGLTKFFRALTDIIKGDKTIPNAFKDAFGTAGEKGMNALLDVWFEISKELGPVGKELWKATKELMGVLWDKVAEWWKKIDWGKVFEAVKPAFIGALGVLFGPAMIKAIASGLFHVVKKGVMNAFGEGGGLRGVFKKFGGKLGALGGPAIAITAAIGINNGIEKFENKISDRFGKTEKKLGASIAGILDTLTFGLLPEELFVDEKGGGIANAIASASESAFKALENYFGKEFTDSFKDYIANALDFAGAFGGFIEAIFSGDKAKIKDATKDLFKKFLKHAKTSAQWMFTQMPGAILQLIVDLGAWIGETTFSILSAVFEGLAEEFAGIPVLGPMFKGMSEAYDGMSKIFGKLPQLFRDVVKKIDAFKDNVVKVSDAIWSGIKAIFKKETWINLGKNIIAGIREALSNLKETITKPFEEAKGQVFDLFEISSPSKVFMRMGQDMMGGLETGMDKNKPADMMSKQSKKMIEEYKNIINSLTPQKVSFGNLVDFDAKESNAAKAISQMVKSANEINSQLNGIEKVNLKPKLENLGKVLGLKGSESLRIEHENFNVDINVVVELDPSKLADAIVDTGKVVKSVKTPRK